MLAQHQSATEFLKLFAIAWRNPATWEQALRSGLTPTQAAGLRDVCDAYGEDFATEEAALMACIRHRAVDLGFGDFAAFEGEGIEEALAATGWDRSAANLQPAKV